MTMALKVFPNNDQQLFIIAIDSNLRGTCSQELDRCVVVITHYAIACLIYLLELNYNNPANHARLYFGNFFFCKATDIVVKYRKIKFVLNKIVSSFLMATVFFVIIIKYTYINVFLLTIYWLFEKIR